MNVKTDLLASAVAGLERTLAESVAGREEDWMAQTDQALARVKQAVKERDAELKSCGGELVDLERPLQHSPTMDRVADELRHELDGVQEEAASLRALTVGAAAGSPRNLAAFRGRVAHLLDALKHFQREEGQVVQEVMNRDIGGEA